ncbi:MAG: hypothetical protein ABSA79_04985 [Candidatus Bathyarchaeia archaeon]|jgi:hypothetical protein
MFDRNLKKLMATVFIVVSVFLTLFAANLVSASGGSISMANTYPEDGGTYSVLDHFTYQTTAVNTNTTVSVSIDNGTLIPMSFQGIINEVVNGDSVARDWYTWQVTIPAITNPGNYTFQFFSHYYVWQDTDQYWAELNARSNTQSFTIADPLPTLSSTTPTLAPTVPQLQSVPELQPWIILPYIAVAILISTLVIRARISKK